MSRQSPQSSSGQGPSSSPFTGTDPTLYSPDLARNPRPGHRRQITVIAAGQQPVPVVQDNTDDHKGMLPPAATYVEGAFLNEMSHVSAQEYISRYQFVPQLPDGTNAGLDLEHELFSVQHYMKLYSCFNTAVPHYAHGVFIRYDDLNDAAEGKEILEDHQFIVEYVSDYDYARAKGQDTAFIKEFDGQIKLGIHIQPNPNHAIWEFDAADLAGVAHAVAITAGAFGTVRNVVHVDTLEDRMQLVFRIEFHSVDAANRAVHSLRLDAVWGMPHDQSFQWCTTEPAHWNDERAMASPHRFMPRFDALGRINAYSTAPTQMLITERYFGRRADRNQYAHPHDQHNRVRRERILDGSDVRTTVMLRNIPNKLDWMALKIILDEVCFGTYDFMYLRIDFKTGNNVGYAFINFADANGMLALIDRIERRSWPGFHSDKTAEISYATIQGREALVQKFRNSSVMHETPYCRPRLVYTLADGETMGQLRIAGTEQPFPRPDNLSKLQRSMDSARSVGLYPPHGYSSIMEHRSRTSAYDRGGPRDILQAAVRFAHQRAAPVPFSGLTEAKKRDIESWYCATYNVAVAPFHCIPMTQIARYFAEFAENSSPMTAPGVIGGPVGNPFPNGTTSIPDGTPTRSSRGAPRHSSGRGYTNVNSFI
ncbi:hypothetical protein BDW02DRAFT_576772 [Decorospora gaudefroyi]|uniref:RRM domain-containing protein n=1 Tax=Decorospora gaudefroyi TaxID=184978 RepID=A0A6A5KW30_9PLEO|nr:hypothetical protein BDW02DRAFT_576772 [Decorospora gaudefroyi]